MNNNQDSSVSRPRLEDLPDKDIASEEYIELWIHFSNRADMLQDKLWSIATWLLAPAGAIIGFILTHWDKTLLLKSVFAGGGILLCAYSLLITVQYGRHIKRNWNREMLLRSIINQLPKILEADKKKNKKKKSNQSNGFPAICWYLSGIASAFIVILLVFVIVSAC